MDDLSTLLTDPVFAGGYNQIPLTKQSVYPLKDLQATGGLDRLPIFPDDLLPTLAMLYTLDTQGNPQTLQCETNKALDVFVTNSSGGGASELDGYQHDQNSVVTNGGAGPWTLSTISGGTILLAAVYWEAIFDHVQAGGLSNWSQVDFDIVVGFFGTTILNVHGEILGHGNDTTIRYPSSTSGSIVFPTPLNMTDIAGGPPVDIKTQAVNDQACDLTLSMGIVYKVI